MTTLATTIPTRSSHKPSTRRLQRLTKCAHIRRVCRAAARRRPAVRHRFLRSKEKARRTGLVVLGGSSVSILRSRHTSNEYELFDRSITSCSSRPRSGT
eukprot:3731520-Prymnesium_polylepis.1